MTSTTSIKYSVLLPTKNRLQLLKLAIKSIQNQDYDNWELIVADNASQEDIESYIASLNDSRIVFTRSTEPLTVTENWNRAVDRMTGDYMLMLGDDDALLPGYFSENLSLIAEHAFPDLVFVQGIQFVYPQIMPGQERSFVQVANCDFMKPVATPYRLSPSDATSVVKDALGFQVSYPFNMQYILIHKTLVLRCANSGAFFRSPYPDYYASNLALLLSTSTFVQPQPLIAVGISPKSFGYFYFNNREAEGVDFLQNIPEKGMLDRLKKTILAGSNMNTSWLIAMETLKQRLSNSQRLSVKYWRYRFLQFRHLFENLGENEFLKVLNEAGSFFERKVWKLLLKYREPINSRLKEYRLALNTFDLVHCPYPKVKIYTKEVGYKNILELCEHFEPRRFLSEYIDWINSLANRSL